ncbi:hypothetical protein LCGC14_0821740 [marine sediment metagenome]|uniref:Uncharacterized protein n=1 Tax=marine sediment metagenome TaxID=412755 RepID=A0A0F9S3D9_9ZZZZ
MAAKKIEEKFKIVRFTEPKAVFGSGEIGVLRIYEDGTALAEMKALDEAEFIIKFKSRASAFFHLKVEQGKLLQRLL